MDRTFGSRSPFPRNRAFVVQFSDTTSGGFNGRVEHVLSGKAVQFRSKRALFEFLKATLTGPPPTLAEKEAAGRS